MAANEQREAPAAVDAEQEHDLLRRCAAGDPTAFNPLVAAYSSKAYHYAYQILRNHHDALDAAQDAFVRAYRALPRFDLGRPFLPWYLRILRNRCLDMIDRRKRQAERPGTEDPEEKLRVVPSSVRGPDRRVVGKEQAQRIQDMIDRLSPDHGEILHLRYFEDMSYEEIADVLQIPKGTVMSRLFHARKKFAQLMTAGDENDELSDDRRE